MIPRPNPSGEPTRPVLTVHNDDGTYTAQSLTSPPEFKVRAECLIPSRLVIPIVFVPGIMGTRLAVKNQPGKSAWFPPENKLWGLWQVLQNLGRNAAARQRLLDPDNTEVDGNGVAHPPDDTKHLLGDAKGETDAERAKWRGWGQVHADSYAEILGVLEKRLALILHDGEHEDAKWHKAMTAWQDDRKMGAQKPFRPMDVEALKLAASVFYPVHAVGYNWLQSNKESANRLAGEITRILDFYSQRKKVADKVIVVTHSMGGLVARACFQLPGMEDKIMGIVHGVMPAIGAPATYKRMRAGFEGIESVIFGRDAGEATAVMANAPGPLELLPTRQYRTKDEKNGERHWLRASCPVLDDDPSLGRRNLDLGDSADPYTSIYLNNEAQSWWRLVKEELIDPAAREDEVKAKREGKKVVKDTAYTSDFDKYGLLIKRVNHLHEIIEDKYHSNTYAYYAADTERPSWNEVHWKAPNAVGGNFVQATLADDNLVGRVAIQGKFQQAFFDIEHGLGSGDGTVPEESGAAPTPHVVQIFCHRGKVSNFESYDHQGSYSTDIGQATTLYSITRMVADSDWLKENLCKA